jgi:FkbM family methyltransferase
VQGFLKRLGYVLTRVPQTPWQVQAALLRDDKVQTIFDVGANVGDVTAAYRAQFPAAKVFAFEPFPECFERLRARFVADEAVQPIRAAATDRDGTRTLYVSTGVTTHSLLQRSRSGSEYFPNRSEVRAQIEVPILTLDGFCREHGIEQVDVLKVDAEGSEILVYRGAREILAEQRVSLIFTEVTFIEHFADQPLLPGIWQALAAHGYTFYDVFDLQRAPNGQLRFGNALFVSPRIRAHVPAPQPG